MKAVFVALKTTITIRTELLLNAWK